MFFSPLINVLMFHSFKGGSGKTILSINVANTLVNEYGKRVLLIEADFSMPSFHNIFQENSPDLFFNSYLNQDQEGLDQYIYPNNKEKFGIVYCDHQFSSKDKVHSVDQTWFLQKIKQLRKDLNKLEYDYVIFDLSPGFHFFTVSALMLSDNVIIILRPDYHSYVSTKDLLKKIYSKAINTKKIKLHIIFNQIPNYNKMQNLVEDWSNELKIEFSYFKEIYQFNFNNETIYNSATQKILLPSSDPLLIDIRKIIDRDLIHIL